MSVSFLKSLVLYQWPQTPPQYHYRRRLHPVSNMIRKRERGREEGEREGDERVCEKRGEAKKEEKDETESIVVQHKLFVVTCWFCSLQCAVARTQMVTPHGNRQIKCPFRPNKMPLLLTTFPTNSTYYSPYRVWSGGLGSGASHTIRALCPPPTYTYTTSTGIYTTMPFLTNCLICILLLCSRLGHSLIHFPCGLRQKMWLNAINIIVMIISRGVCITIGNT